MELEIQIKSLSYSIFFGMIFSLVFNFIYINLFKLKKVNRFFISMLFMIIASSLYFRLLLLINNGILNYYMFISFCIGFVIGNSKTKKLRKRT